MTNSVEARRAIHVRSAVPTFLAPDVAGTARWYDEHLGFRVVGHVPDHGPYVYASVQRDEAEIILLSMPDYRKPDLSKLRPSGLWDAYFRMDGVEALYEAVRGKAFVKMSLQKQRYGDWEFEVWDPNGYILTFGGGA
ncbi:MAG TPA: VOC family protein [Thermoanaerobaculia bacterium]|nr:VOC family protein [Thermoanaerobaculia bacterium]